MPLCGEDYPGNMSYRSIPIHTKEPTNACCIEERKRIGRYLQQELNKYNELGFHFIWIERLVERLHKGVLTASGEG